MPNTILSHTTYLLSQILSRLQWVKYTVATAWMTTCSDQIYSFTKSGICRKIILQGVTTNISNKLPLCINCLSLLYNTHYKYYITCLTYLIKNHPSSSQRWRSLTIITASACISGYNSVIYHKKHTGPWLERLSHEASLTWQQVSSIFINCSHPLP